ncbi:preprotein translocase subunit Sec61beta [Candidatus Altiarchaeota archaeon]
MPTLKKRQVQGPSGGAGLIRYFDVDEGGPKLDPKLIVGLVVAIIILEILSAIVLG